MRKIDPVHFFNAKGISVLTTEFQGTEIDRLRKENEDLKRRLRNALIRLRENKEARKDESAN